MPQQQLFDAIIIGSGQAGTPLTSDLAKAGWKTALIEQAHYGGTCINEGCTPTKTLIASARSAYAVRRAADYGVMTSTPTIDFHKVVQRKDEIVKSWSEKDKNKLEKTENVTLFFGHAQFTGPHTIEVTDTKGIHTLEGKTIFINTGGRPAPPDFPGADSIPVLNSTTVMDLTALPDHLVIIGGGYVGLEFAQFFRRLGSRVTIIEAGKTFLAREDRDIADAVRKVLEEEGIVFRIGTTVTNAKPSGKSIEIKTSDGSKHQCSHVLYAAGRDPNTNDLGLDKAGIGTDDRGYIRVTPKLETNVKQIYALGDVTGAPAFTHISYDDYRIVRDNLLHNGNRITTGRLVPNVTFIDPQLARIGMTEEDAKSKGTKFRIASMPMSHVARAIEVDEQKGLMKAVIGEDDQILGATIFGIEGGEIMSMIEIAMMAHLKTSDLYNAIFAHPTLAESLNNLFR
jgi:pyruvate/2-oxoglutarate dehydrogenase complex dihydrolipoamide dehydrogenase (E3) component